MGRIITALFIPALVWLLVGSCRELKGNYGKESFNEYMGGIVWVVSVTLATIGSIVYVVEGKSLAHFIHLG